MVERLRDKSEAEWGLYTTLSAGGWCLADSIVDPVAGAGCVDPVALYCAGQYLDGRKGRDERPSLSESVMSC